MRRKVPRAQTRQEALVHHLRSLRRQAPDRRAKHVQRQGFRRVRGRVTGEGLSMGRLRLRV